MSYKEIAYLLIVTSLITQFSKTSMPYSGRGDIHIFFKIAFFVILKISRILDHDQSSRFIYFIVEILSRKVAVSKIEVN